MAPDCLVCRELSGDVPVPGGMLVDEEHVLAFHLPPLPGRGDPYLGHLLVSRGSACALRFRARSSPP